MFSRILVANRGEIACRVIETCHRLGMAAVAVYSDADAGAKHVALADDAVRIGLPQPSESYLRGDRIIEAALATRAEAIHPGYGLLSENPDFVEAVGAAGLTFVGPPASAIRAMGLKDAAKALMSRAGVPVVPGYNGEHQDDAVLAAEAEAIGFPVLIKAVAGGGGRGMRRVDRRQAFAVALAAARGEAQAAFGNDRVLIEKYIETPRHIEFQIFADAFGNAVHLFERDCSLQRRHQKVIEEAPAPGMTDGVRHAMGTAAVQAAKAVGYVGAGTVEFIAAGGGLRPDSFWFMEMNTRLQVEHPVTEAITGEDLVEWQLRVAAGEPLPKRQDQLGIRGHAVEARLYAEDPAAGFLPAVGTIARLSFPAGVRVDSGVREGDAVTPFYDPMIAKVVARGPTRATALRSLARALDETRIAGLVTNLGFLARLCRQADFAEGRVDTGLIERHLPMLTTPLSPPPELLAVAAIAAEGLLDQTDPLTGFALWQPLPRTVRLEGGGAHLVRLAVLGPRRFRADDRPVEVAAWRDGELDVRFGGEVHRFGLARLGRSVTVFRAAESWTFTMADPLARDGEAHAESDEIRAPMPGLVKQLAARPGMTVARGDPLVVLEAMKMEHALTAPRDGVVAEVLVRAGAQVTDGTTLLRFEPRDG